MKTKEPRTLVPMRSVGTRKIIALWFWVVLLALGRVPCPAHAEARPPRRSGGYLASSRSTRKAAAVKADWRHAWRETPEQTPPATSPGKTEGGAGRPQSDLPPPRDRAAPEVVPSPRGRPQTTLQFRMDDTDQGHWNLDQLTRLALENNPILRRARARVDSARGTALQAGIWSNPRWDTNNPEVIGAGLQQAYNAGFQLEIPVKGKKRLDRAAAMQQVREATFSAWSDRYDVLQSVREQFYGLLIQQRRVAGLEEVVRVTAGARDAAKRLFDAEQVAETDVLLLALEMQKAEAALLQARTLLISDRRQLAAVVGLPGLPIAAVLGDPADRPPPFDDLFVRRYVASQNVDVLNSRAEVSRTSLLLTRARVEPWPNPYTGPAAQWGPLNLNQQFWMNGSFLIPTWNLNQGGIRAARWDNQVASADVGVTRNRLLDQAADALGRHRAALQLAEKIRTEIVPTAKRNFKLVQKGYRGGILPVFQFLEAQRSLFDANLSYIDALDDVWSSAATLGNLLQMEQFP
ncbi:MAG TPA: TolC family protein [Pirellulales bacterium]|nr:TolC family protein [Pirellulales bacterium]